MSRKIHWFLTNHLINCSQFTISPTVTQTTINNSNIFDSTLLCTSNTTHTLTSISPTPKLRKTPQSTTPSTTKLRKSLKHRHRWLVHWLRSFATNILPNKQSNGTNQKLRLRNYWTIITKLKSISYHYRWLLFLITLLFHKIEIIIPTLPTPPSSQQIS